jgi:chemotaxis protein methyltransferase CheR
MAKISPLEFSVFSKYLFEISGISLPKGKEYLFDTRLAPLLAEYKCFSFSELYYKARRDNTLEEKIIDAITTNETYFFRDIFPFELLQYKVLPDLIDKRMSGPMPLGKIPLRIWSAGCSTGQEVYSITFIIDNLNLSENDYDIYVLGTDISNAAISKASYGAYSNFELSRGLQPDQIETYFTRINDNTLKIKDKYRWMVSFKTHNLFTKIPTLKKFDIILCRNVGIYFSPQDRKRLYRIIREQLADDGYLLIGSTESLTHDTDLFIPQKYLRAQFYQPNPDVSPDFS